MLKSLVVITTIVFSFLNLQAIHISVSSDQKIFIVNEECLKAGCGSDFADSLDIASLKISISGISDDQAWILFARKSSLFNLKNAQVFLEYFGSTKDSALDTKFSNIKITEQNTELIRGFGSVKNIFIKLQVKDLKLDRTVPGTFNTPIIFEVITR